MSEEGFFRRWARLKSSGPEAPAEAVAPAPAAPLPAQVPPTALAQPEPAPQAPLPTLEDAARLTPDADFSAFVARGVDKSVQRLALKKLFADPHFRIIDGLDTYMHDYNKAAPLAPAMLASLKHAPDVLSRLLGDQQDGQQDGTEAEAHEHQDEQAPPSTRQGKA
jgi:hypothetical protein